MKKKLVSIVLAALMAATLITGCGGKEETQTAAPAPAAETETEETETEETASTPAEETETETESEEESVDNSASEDFTLLDVSTDMIQAGVYAVSDDGTELVFSMFTEPSGTPMASLFIFPAEGEGDVICGADRKSVV